MNARKGIKMFGEKAVAAILKEFKQLNEGAFPGKPVVEPIEYKSLSPQEIRMAMEAVNLIKEKRNGVIKGRTCANGSLQRRYLAPEDSVASPTPSTEAIISSFVIDAFEERAIGIFDIPGAYLHADMKHDKGRVLMVLRDEFVDYMCEVDPKYLPYVQYIKGRKVLYLKVLRAIYGCIESALLWYELFTNTLKKMGFVINPYDKCVANKLINGSQCTIMWYVDNAKVSHKQQSVVENVIQHVEECFGKMNPTYGPEQDYLGMKISIKNKKVHINMSEQIQEIIDGFSEKIEGTVSTPATRHLMDINDSSNNLNKARSEEFHTTVARLLYLTKRARPDIETSVAFLTTRVSKATDEDWDKLRRVLIFLKQTMYDDRIIACDSLESVFTWIDAAHAVHSNSMRGQIISLGWGALHCKSSKQKINTKSSTESELVGLSEYVPYNLWFINFLEAQGYEIKQNIIFQDNESTIRMARNGRNSCTGNSRHINTHYFFVKDRVDNGELSISYSPTYNMLADFFTKPLQGSLFHKFRDVIMGQQHISTILIGNKSYDGESKERVGKQCFQEVLSHHTRDNIKGYKEVFYKPPSIGEKMTYVQREMVGNNNSNDNDNSWKIKEFEHDTNAH